MKSITVLKLKLDIDNNGEAETLNRIAGVCRKARNAAAEDWLLRQHGKEETEKQSKRLCVQKKHKDRAEKSESTKLYHAVTAAEPDLGTTNAGMIAASVWSNLSAKIDWRRSNGNGNGENDKRLKRKDMILAHEDRLPCYTTLEIPVRSADSKIEFHDEAGAWTLTTRRPLRSIQSLVIKLKMRGLPPGKKKILADVATGVRKFADSRIVEKRGKWYWYLPVVFETEVRSDVVAELWPVIGSEKDGKQTDRPFRLVLPNRSRPWYIGDGRYLLAQEQRLVGLRKMVGYKYRKQVAGGTTGHGRKKVDEAVSRRNTQLANVRGEVRRRAIADVVEQCVKSGCGKLVYREPTGPTKDKCWFQAIGLDWDWTRFVGDLKNACARQGIEVQVRKLKIKEVLAAVS